MLYYMVAHETTRGSGILIYIQWGNVDALNGLLDSVTIHNRQS